MKRMVWISLVALVTTVVLGGTPVHSLAQPTPAPTTTQINVFVPWQQNGDLSPSLQARSRDSFPQLQCQSASIATTRPDAWRCGTDDPCFAPPFTDPNAASVTLACSSGPWTSSVQLLTVQGSLRTADDCKNTPRCRLPLDLTANPWAVQLSNGVRCTLFTGTISSLGGVGMIYGCAQADGTPAGTGGTASAGLDRSSASGGLWQVFYQSPGDYTLQQVAVLIAWY